MSSMDVARSVDVQCLERLRLTALLLGPERFRVNAVVSSDGAAARRDFRWERLVLPAPYLFSNVAERLGRRSSGLPSVYLLNVTESKVSELILRTARCWLQPVDQPDNDIDLSGWERPRVLPAKFALLL